MSHCTILFWVKIRHAKGMRLRCTDILQFSRKLESVVSLRRCLFCKELVFQGKMIPGSRDISAETLRQKQVWGV